MDPITLIVSALAAGAAAGATETVKQAIGDAYTSLKVLIKRKLGGRGEVDGAIEMVERDPKSTARQSVLAEELTKVGAPIDDEIVAAAKMLLERLRSAPGGEQHIQEAVGSYIAQADRGSTARVNVYVKPSDNG